MMCPIQKGAGEAGRGEEEGASDRRHQEGQLQGPFHGPHAAFPMTGDAGRRLPLQYEALGADGPQCDPSARRPSR